MGIKMQQVSTRGKKQGPTRAHQGQTRVNKRQQGSTSNNKGYYGSTMVTISVTNRKSKRKQTDLQKVLPTDRNSNRQKCIMIKMQTD